jgi:CheY-like chemotaxis protein
VTRHVLYIEDNLGDFELMAEAFREIRCDASLERIPDGFAALELIDGFPQDAPLPALLMIDVNLPKADGVTVLERVKLHERLRHVPAIMLTSSTSQVDRSRCRKADDYLAKGTRWNDCLELARRLCAAAQLTIRN